MSLFPKREYFVAAINYTPSKYVQITDINKTKLSSNLFERRHLDQSKNSFRI